jgi:molybdenum cofactor biosynthesis protein B
MFLLDLKRRRDIKKGNDLNLRGTLMGTKEHKAHVPQKIKVAVISVSTTRTLDEDKSGHWMVRQAIKEGLVVVYHQVVPDQSDRIAKTVLDVLSEHAPQVILLTGGTGISPQDVTIEAVRPLFDKELTAFGPLFAQLSYEEIDSAALLSRATAGLLGQTILFCMPGSLKACQLACTALIFPEIGHLAKHASER